MCGFSDAVRVCRSGRRPPHKDIGVYVCTYTQMYAPPPSECARMSVLARIHLNNYFCVRGYDCTFKTAYRSLHQERGIYSFE